MKITYTLLLASFFLFSCGNDKDPKTSNKTEPVPALETTYLLIRHAEKDRSDPDNSDPELNAKGLERARQWAGMLENYDVEMVFATDYKRTKQTARPIADSRGLKVTLYDPNSLYNDKFKTLTNGKTVVVVGHSNTTPAFANAILGEEKFDAMDDSENALLYKVIVNKDGATGSVSEVEMYN